VLNTILIVDSPTRVLDDDNVDVIDVVVGDIDIKFI
jgi:hypothetical protein